MVKLSQSRSFPAARFVATGLLAMVWIACLSTSLPAQTSYPMLMSLSPVAVQVGQSSEHTIESRYTMYGAYEVLVTGEGVTGEILHPEKKEGEEEKEPNLQQMKVRFTASPDALPGVRDFRIATPHGASTLGQVVVVTEPVIVEADKNNTSEEAQSVEVPAVLCGAIEKAEDVDFFRFHATAGMKLTFHVRSMRLQNKIHDLQQHVDPILTLRNDSGSTLAASDNHFFGDPFFSYTFERDGDYLLELRDVRYQGNKYWQYCIEVLADPFVTNAYPLAVRRGEAAKLELIGTHLPDDSTVTWEVPADQPLGNQRVRVEAEGKPTNPVPVVVSELPLTLEQAEPNETVETAQTVELPAGINGRIESESDLDYFRFEAKKGEKYSFEVIARRHGSSLDPHLRILNEKGNQLQLNDDLRIGKRSYADSWIENWTVPADGTYFIEIRDLHLRGGEAYVYFLQVTRAEPYFLLFADTDKTPLTPGTGGIIYVRVEKKNGFDGDIQLAIEGLPDSVTAHCGKILAGSKNLDGCIVLQAAPDAPQAIRNVRIFGTSTAEGPDGQALDLRADVTPYQEIYQPGGGRGHWPVKMHSVSVGEPSDILKVELSTQELVLKPGESATVDVKLERAEGFDKNVTLDVIYKHLNGVYGNSLPEGVSLDSAKSKTLLTGDTVEGKIVLKADEKAPATEKQQIAVMANVSLNFVMKATYASAPLLITVEGASEEAQAE